MPQVEATIRLFLALFYADDGYIASTDEVILQESMDILVELFERVGLRTNVSKTKAKTCVDGKIRTRLSDAAYTNSQVGLHTQAAWDRRRLECDVCGKQLAASSMSNHLETQHDVYRSKVINKDLLVDRDPVEYEAYRSMNGKYDCPVPGCVGNVRDQWNLRRHFRDRHPRDSVSIDGDDALPKCERCAMQTSDEAYQRGHMTSGVCREGMERIVQREAAVNSARALEVIFTAYYGEELERVEVFKYLGRLLAMDDNDMQAVRANLKKARKCWKMFSRLLRGENMDPRVCGMFYKAVVQSVLLFGSETWVLTPSAMRCLEGFHIRSAYRMAKVHKPRKEQRTGTWKYPSSVDVLEEVGLKPIREYIEVRRQTVANYIVNRPIFDLCMDAVRRRGTSHRLYWWEQPVDWDLARAAIDDAAVVAESDQEQG